MKTRITFLILAALHLALASCTTARKNRTAASGDNGGVNLLAAIEPVTENEIQSLKAIADSPAAMLPASADDEDTVTLGIGNKPSTAGESSPGETIPSATWKRPGLNPEEVNPGDVFGESAGPFLHKSLSLADELPPTERRTLLNHFTTIKTARVPMSLTRREINGLQAEAGTGTPLPTRSVAFEFRSENRSVAAGRLEELLAQLGQGEAAEPIESVEHRTRLKSQIATVKKRLKAGERLFIVTAVTESEAVTASYPGAQLGEEDPALISNALKARYPHLNSLEARRKDNSVLITGKPRILWGYETSELILRDDQLEISSTSVAQL